MMQWDDFGNPLWSEDGDLPDQQVLTYLRWYPMYGAYFVDKHIRRKAEVVTTNELAQRINDGSYNYDSSHDLENRESSDTAQLLISAEVLPRETLKVTPVPPGMYQIVVSNQLGVGLRPYEPKFDDYVDLKTHTQDIQTDIDTFLKKREAYQQMGLLHRRGVLLYGPPGGGKSLLIEKLCSQYVKQARILVIQPEIGISTLGALKALLSDMMTFFVFEELTSITSNPGEVASFLNFMDGVNAWDSCLVLATTNYPEKLQGNVVDRPSRFDRLYRVDNPSEEVRRIYLEAKIGPQLVTDELINLTKGYSIAYLKELAVYWKIFEGDPVDKVREFETRKRLIKKEFAENKSDIGF